MVNWILRRAKPQDAPAFTRCVAAAYRSYIPQIGRYIPPLLADYSEEVALYQVWVAEEEGQIIGGLVLIPKEDHMLLANIAVHPNHQDKGVGQSMLKLADAETLAQGYQELRLYTNKIMNENTAMYKRSGWSEMQCNEQEGHKILMRKLLQSLDR
jgi:N-acetylglutamate synthase-like GNAT family acetyltransferase